MKFLFQCPCCSCFCFMKPQKGKSKTKIATEAKLEAKQGKTKEKPNVKESGGVKSKVEDAAGGLNKTMMARLLPFMPGKKDKEAKLEAKEIQTEGKPTVKEGGGEKPEEEGGATKGEVVDTEKKDEGRAD